MSDVVRLPIEKVYPRQLNAAEMWAEGEINDRLPFKSKAKVFHRPPDLLHVLLEKRRLRMVEPTPLKTKDDYSEHTVIKTIDGKPVEYVNIDAMTEAQWQRYCRETGTEPFRRMNIIA